MIEVKLLSHQNRVLQHWNALCNPHDKDTKQSIKHTQKETRNENVSLQNTQLNTKQVKGGIKGQKVRDIQKTINTIVKVSSSLLVIILNVKGIKITSQKN